MRLDYVVEFYVLSETLNYSEAAFRLYISEASLSRHIRALEEELGQDLFKRSTRKVELTDFAEKLLPYARHLSETQDKLLEAVRWHSRPIVNIGIIGTIRDYVNLNGLVSDYSKVDPSVVFNVAVVTDVNVLFSGRNAPDLYILPELANCYGSDGLQHCLIQRDRLIAVVPNDSAYARQGYITVEDFRREHIITLSIGTPWYRLFMSAINASSIPSQSILAMESGFDVVELVGAGQGVSALMDHASRHRHKDYPYSGNARFVPIIPEISIDINLICPENPSRVIRNFAQFVTEHIEEYRIPE